MSVSFQKIAVVGAGAVGLYYGGRLAAAGADASFLVRSDYDALKNEGLRVESVHGDFQLPAPRVFRRAEDIGPVDLVIVTWKSTANPRLAEVLPPLLHSGTEVLTLQNGLGNCEAIAAIAGPQRVLGGLCFVCINRIRPGLVRHSGGGRIALGEWQPGEPNRAREIAGRFKQAGVPAIAVDNLQQAQWEKLVWNIPFNGLSVAEGGVTTDVLLDRCETEIRALMAEIIAAARAQGLELDGGLIDHNLTITRPLGAYKTSSMIDYLEGREVEVEPIWREPLRRARAAGVPMPRLENLLRRIEARLPERGHTPGGG